MLILAGVSLSLVVGQNGVLTKAQEAVTENRKATAKEEIAMAWAACETNYMTAWTTNQSVKREDFFTPAKLNENLVRKGTVKGVEYNANGTSEVEYISNDNNIKYIMEVDQYGNVELSGTPTVATNPTTTPSGSDTTTDSTDTSTDNSNTTTDSSSEETPIITRTQAEKAQHPEEHMPSDAADWEHVTGTWDTGYVIREKATGDEFVWIPVTGVSEDDTTSNLADNLKITYTKKSGSKNYGNQSNTSENIDVLSAEYIKGDVTGLNKIFSETENVSQNLPNESPEKAVVNNAGGFWVSRYEIGFERSGDLVTGELTSSDYWNDFKASNLKSVEGVEPVRCITQEQALSLANQWKTNTNYENAQSGLITGTQWDVMCNFIDWDTCDSDCKTWGNYYDAIGTISKGHMGKAESYADANYYYWTILSDNSTIQKDQNKRTVSATGSFIVSHDGTTNSTAQKNIYDVAGNVWEWTTEVPLNGYNSDTNTGTNRVIRGGSTNNYGYHSVATDRVGGLASTSSDWTIGFRAVLYVK
jgi:formylglycine-generating enzyme required for sulfatase activity